MDTAEKPRFDDFAKAFVTGRRLVILMVVASSFMLYSRLSHLSARSHVPRHFAGGFEIFGRVGLALDLFCYFSISAIVIEIIRSTRDRLAIMLLIGMIGPFVINPLKMLLPQQASLVWWAQLFLCMTFFIASVIALAKLVRGRAEPSPTQAG